jgi:hypothetical protein
MPLIEPPGRFFVPVTEDHLGILFVRFPAEMVRDAILAAFFHRFLPVSVLSDASASLTLYGVKLFPNAADGLAMNADGLDETDHLFPARRGQPLRSLAHGPVTEHFALPVAIYVRPRQLSVGTLRGLR